MKINFNFILIILVALILRIFVTFYQDTDLNFRIQQDNYTDYATALEKGFSGKSFVDKNDARLFPGYPLLIMAVNNITHSPIASGYLISLFSSLISIYLFRKIFRNNLATLIFAIFPPVWITQSSKVATEPVTVLLLIISVFLFRKNQFFYTGLIVGFAADVRLISICLLFGYIYYLWISDRKREIAELILGFMPMFILLFIFNYFVFGLNGIFKQFIFYPEFGHASFGLIQIFKDFYNSLQNNEFRTVLSGGFYVMFSLLAFYGLFLKRKVSKLYNLLFMWTFFSFIFIFSYGPTPLLGEYKRFILPFLPALIMGIIPIRYLKHHEGT